jgi:hypothetical protein
VPGGDLDVFLGEVPSIRRQRRTLGQLGTDRIEVIGGLLERRLKLFGVGCLIGELGRDDYLRLGVNAWGETVSIASGNPLQPVDAASDVIG